MITGDDHCGNICASIWLRCCNNVELSHFFLYLPPNIYDRIKCWAWHNTLTSTKAYMLMIDSYSTGCVLWAKEKQRFSAFRIEKKKDLHSIKLSFLQSFSFTEGDKDANQNEQTKYKSNIIYMRSKCMAIRLESNFCAAARKASQSDLFSS